jgi:FAD/FMN-containing dehydrogenase
MATLPPGVSSADFSAALRKFEAAIGEQWVFKSDEDVALYRDAYSPERDEPTERLTSAAVAPNTVEQVQQIVRIANEHKIPLYPISTGKNLGYGGSAPILSGSVVVDLKRMNRILSVDEGRCSAIVEPGVSYFDLYRYIQERNLKAGAASSAMHWITVSATPMVSTGITSGVTAVWRSCCPTASSCVPAWRRWPMTNPGPTTSTVSVLMSPDCSVKPISGS